MSNGYHTEPLLDCLIIGGGPAGLSVATGLARQLYRVVVFDSGSYRNDATTHMHNVATWDHRRPAEFREAARRSILDRYSTILIEDTTIENVKQTDAGHFQAMDTNGTTWVGKKLVLATGVRDIFPDIPGYQECWVTGIFGCLFCHGYEDRGAEFAGVLAIGDLAAVFPAMLVARMAKRLAGDVTIYTDNNESLSKQIRESLGKSSIKVDSRSIARLEKRKVGAEVTIHFADKSVQTEGFLVHKPKTELNGPFAHQLALDLTGQGDIKVTEPAYSTSMPGVFAVGDCATPMKAVVQAMATGAFGAGGVSAQLTAELY